MSEATPEVPSVPGSMPFVHNLETAPAYWWLDILWVVLVDGADTGGRYSLMHETLPKGSGAPPHKHTWSDEHFYMLQGEISFLVGEEIKVGRAGDFVYVPRNTRHAFRVDGDTAVFLNGYTPAGLELAVIEKALPAPERVTPPRTPRRCPSSAPNSTTATAWTTRRVPTRLRRRGHEHDRQTHHGAGRCRRRPRLQDRQGPGRTGRARPRAGPSRT